VESRQEAASGQAALHSRATILLATRLPAAAGVVLSDAGAPYRRPVQEAYRDLLFHGLDLQGIRQVERIGPEIIIGRVAIAPPPAQWLDRPLRASWLAEPMVLDTSFQLMVLWCWENHGMPLLPTALGTYRQFCRTFPRDGVRVIAHVTAQAQQSVRADIDYVDSAGRLLARIEGGEFVTDVSLKESFRNNQLVFSAR
jgi:hypothetical protein